MSIHVGSLILFKETLNKYVIARSEATWRSITMCSFRLSGLLRCARNDGFGLVQRFLNYYLVPGSQSASHAGSGRGFRNDARDGIQDTRAGFFLTNGDEENQKQITPLPLGVTLQCRSNSSPRDALAISISPMIFFQ
ncbi:MAG: hypothetical protein KGJ19_05655, partial [Betaproteobacteria bacterium]|nr:hypothetical protein [Betaproteobacteria bacterium]